MNRRFFFVLGLVAVGAAPAGALEFNETWKSQDFPRRKPNAYSLRGSSLGIESNKGVSLLLRKVSQSDWASRKAIWSWSVENGVPATDLAKKGGDDRNIAIYFTFLPEDRANELGNSSASTVLMDKSSRTLMYVWGGNAPRGAFLSSPYLAGRAVTIVQRNSATGTFSEQVNLAADYQKAFGEAPEALFGIAISADSDDTKSRISAGVSSLRLQK